MAEYIEREKVLEEINDIITDVDVVSVVRCRDCKWYKLPQLACALSNRTRWTDPNDYCSYGERRCDNDTQ